MAAAAAGGGGGGSGNNGEFVNADTLIDCGNSVLRFARMLGFTNPITTSDQFMTNIIIPIMNGKPDVIRVVLNSIKVLENPILSDGYGDLQYLTRKDSKGVPQTVSGAYGAVLRSRTNRNIIWKKINYNHPIKDGKSINILPMILIETFIQFIMADAYKDNNFIPYVCDIRKSSRKSEIFICMERAQEELHTYIQKQLKEDPRGFFFLSDTVFYDILRTIIVNLIDYNEKFNLVHRDTKLNNFVIVKYRDRVYIKLIDFGFACMQIKIGKNNYNIKTANTMYDNAVTCAPEQDMLVLLLEMINSGLAGYLSPKAKAFYEAIIEPALKAEVGQRRSALQENAHMAMYNRNGTLTVREPKLAHYLTPSFVLEKLAEAFSPSIRAQNDDEAFSSPSNVQNGGRHRKTKRIVDGSSGRSRRRGRRRSN